MGKSRTLESKNLKPGLRILHLEDNPVDAELIECELREAGIVFTFKVVETGESFLKALEEFSPDIILSDYDLPCYDGASALADAKKHCPEVPFILVTGAVTEDRAIEILTSGAKDYVLKNRLTRLVPAVRRALADAEEHKARRKAERELRAAHRSLEKKVKERTAELQEEIEERRRIEESLLKAKEFSEALNHVNELLHSTLDPDEVIQRVVDVGVKLLGSEAAAVSLREDGGWTVSYVNGMPSGMVGARMTDLEEPHAFLAITSMQPVAISDAWNDKRVNHEHMIEYNVRAVLVAPMIGREGPLGVIFFNHHTGPHSFEEIEIYFARQLASTAAIALYNARLFSGRKLAEAALQESEERYRGVVQNTTAVILRVDPQGIIRFANERALKFFDYSEDELIGKHAVGTIIPEKETTGRSLAAMVDEIREDPDRFRANANENMLKNGERVWMEWTNSGIYDESGRLKEFLAVGIDATDRKRAEETLKKRGERLRLALEAGRHGDWDWDLATGHTVWNGEHYRIFGYEPGAITPGYEAWRMRVHPEDLAGAEAKLKESMEKGGDYAAEYRALWPDGTVRWLDVRGRYERDAEGRSVRSYGIIEDISEHKMIENALREKEERLAAALRTARMAYWDWDSKDDRIVSSDMSDVFGLLPGESLDGQDYGFRVVHPDDVERHRALIRQAARSGESWHTEFRIIRPRDGNLAWLEEHANARRDPETGSVHISGLVWDITERKRAEEERERLIAKLETANRELEGFTYSASHDLRAPLQAIDGFSAMLKKALDGRLDDEESRRFDVIRANTKKMNHLIDDLLALSRIGRAEISCKPLNMHKLTESVWHQIREAHPELEVVLKIGELPEVLGDASLIWQVLSNLLTNAVKFTRKRETAVIEIGGGTQDSECFYYVRDNGAGFDMAYYDKLFGVFQRLHSESEYEGTGVGLAIVQRIIHRHGGRVWAEGEPGKGAMFYFSLPKISEAEKKGLCLDLP